MNCIKTIKICTLTAVVTLLSSSLATAKEGEAFDKTLMLNGINFHITCPNEGSLNTLTIVPSGLSIDNSIITEEIDGSLTGAQIDDLNGDGSPEVYVFINSAGSGSYGSLVAYASNNNKSISTIYLPPLENDEKNSKGYMGHDTFAVMDGHLTRHFPLYKENDTNAKPTGGTRQLHYTLVAGEATWILELTGSKTFPPSNIPAPTVEHSQLKAFPPAAEGIERFVIELPKKERSEEERLKVELIPGKIMLTDGINRTRIGLSINPHPLKGWGYTYYEVTGSDVGMSTLMAVPEGKEQVTKLVHGSSLHIPYNSRLPIVIYSPGKYEIQYRIWSAGTSQKAMRK